MEKKNEENKSMPFYKVLLKNVIWAAVAVLAFVFVVNLLLRVGTNYGKIIAVPDFTNMTVKEAEFEAKTLDLRIDVVDSVYVRRMGRGLVYSQNPKPGTGVKSNRRILLTINSVTPKKVQVPNLVGLSMRQAKAELLSRGLRVGKLIYVEDIATNNVLKQLYRNRELEPGKQIESSTAVDLMLGLNPQDSATFVPNLVGLKYLRAVDVIHDNSLNVANVVFDSSIKTYADSLDAVVTRQTPESVRKAVEEEAGPVSVLKGSEITIYLANDSITK